MLKTISRVADTPRKWDGPKGAVYFLKIWFTDGSEGEAGAQSEENANKYRDVLNSLVGQEGEFELESKPAYNNIPQFKVKSWPGKESFGGFKGGGGKSYTPRYEDTPEGFWHKQRSIYRSVALQQALQFVGRVDSADILAEADSYYRWLCATIPALPSQPAVQPEAEATRTFRSEQRVSDTVPEVWEGPGQCPQCYAPPNKRHVSPCIVRRS